VLDFQVLVEDLESGPRAIPSDLKNQLLDKAAFVFEIYVDARIQQAKVGVLEDIDQDLDDQVTMKDYVG
jgi:hypothetical protein